MPEPVLAQGVSTPEETGATEGHNAFLQQCHNFHDDIAAATESIGNRLDSLRLTVDRDIEGQAEAEADQEQEEIDSGLTDGCTAGCDGSCRQAGK